MTEGTPTAIATAAPATISASGVFNNPNLPAPVNAPGRLAESVVHESMRADIAAGKFTADQADAILTRDGFKPLGIAPEPAPVRSTPASGAIPANLLQWERQLIAAGIPEALAREKVAAVAAAGQDAAAEVVVPALSPQEQGRMVELEAAGWPSVADLEQRMMEYDFGPVFTDERGNYDHAGNKNARLILAAAGFDREQGSAFGRALHADAVQTSSMTDGQRELYQRSERVKLERLWGPAYGENVKLTLAFIDRLHGAVPGGVWGILDKAGGLSARTAAMIFHRVQDARAAVAQHRSMK